jgi:type I restriction enzyme S subunit
MNNDNRNDWQESKLGEVAEKFAMGPFGSNIKADNFVAFGVPVIRGTNLNYAKYVGGDFVFLTEEKADQLKSSNCFPGDLVFTHRGTLGQVGLIPEGHFNRYVISQSGMKLSVKKDILDKDFLFYFFKSSVGMHELLQHEAQVGVPSISNPLTSLKSVNILLPPIPEQRAIADVLSSLDDKIDLLNRQNKTIEALAATLWRKMFVENADPNWKKGKLGDFIASIETGRRPKGGIDPNLDVGIPSVGAENVNGIGNYEYGKTKYITEEYFNQMNTGIIQNYDILIYKDGAYIGKKSMFANGFPYKKCCINEHVFLLRTGKVNNQLFLYFVLEQEELEQLNANSAQPGLNQEALKSFEIVIPPEDVIADFGSKVGPFIDKIFANSIQIRTLSTLRDSLLPKLMSGEVRVKV